MRLNFGGMAGSFAALMLLGVSAAAQDKPSVFFFTATSTPPAEAASPIAPTTNTGAQPLAVSEKPGGPRIVFASTNLDFGRVEAGKIVNHDFIFTNTGNQELEIKDVQPSCGCTTTALWDRKIQPGKTGRIPARFNSTEFVGHIYKTINVFCNDPTRSKVTLDITGTVWKPIEVTPELAGFGVSSDSETNETRTLSIINNLEAPLEVSDPSCTNQFFQVALRTVLPGKEYALDVTFLVSKFLPREITSPTNITVPITLKSSSKQFPIFSVPASANVMPALIAMPSQIALTAGPLAGGAQFSLLIRNNGNQSLVLSEPGANVPGIDARIQEIQPGRRFVMTVVFPVGFKAERGQNVEVRVKTNNPRFPVLRVPVHQDQPPEEAAKEQASAPPAVVSGSAAPAADNKK